MFGRKMTSFFLGLSVLISLILNIHPWLNAPGFCAELQGGQGGGDVKSWLNELESRAPAPKNPGYNINAVKGAASAAPQAFGDGKERHALMPSLVRDGNKAARISVDFYKTDLHNVFRLLGQVSGKNIVVDEGVKGTITLALQDVPWTFVLEVIKNLNGLDSIERDNTIMIYPDTKSITWARTDSSSLELAVKSPVFNRFAAESSQRYQTPAEQIAKAEDMVKEAEAAERQGNMNQAFELYKSAASDWPENVSLSKKVASIALGREGDELTGLNYAKMALRIAPQDVEAATFAAIALARMGKTNEARVYFEKAISSDKASRQALYNYAVFCFDHGWYRDALRTINRIENNYIVSPELMMLKGRVYEGLNNVTEAVSEYRAIINAGGEVPADISQFAKSRLGQLAAQRGGSN